MEATERSSLCYSIAGFLLPVVTTWSMKEIKMSGKEKIADAIGYLTEEQSEILYFVLSLVRGCQTMQEVRKFCELYDCVDTAVPQDWFNEVEALRIDPREFVWSYQKNKLGGEPVHVWSKFIHTLLKKFEG